VGGRPPGPAAARLITPLSRSLTCGRRSRPSARMGAAPNGAKPSRRMPAPAS